MPNAGMLDHHFYGRNTYVHWMQPWPARGAGYQTVRSLRIAEFSRHLHDSDQVARGGLVAGGGRTARPTSGGIPRRPSNDLCPFYTVEKPACGFFFSRETDNRKRLFGIPPSNLVSWRSGFLTARHTHSAHV